MGYLQSLTNKVVCAYFESSKPEDEPNFIGVMVGFYDHPTALIDTGDGLHPHAWSGNLVREATREEEVEFWRNRAIKAEEQVERLKELA